MNTKLSPGLRQVTAKSRNPNISNSLALGIWHWWWAHTSCFWGRCRDVEARQLSLGTEALRALCSQPLAEGNRTSNHHLGRLLEGPCTLCQTLWQHPCKTGTFMSLRTGSAGKASYPSSPRQVRVWAGIWTQHYDFKLMAFPKSVYKDA